MSWLFSTRSTRDACSGVRSLSILVRVLVSASSWMSNATTLPGLDSTAGSEVDSRSASMRASATVSQPLPMVASTAVSPGRMTARHSVCAMSVVRLLVTMTSSKWTRARVEVDGSISAAVVAPILLARRGARVAGPDAHA